MYQIYFLSIVTTLLAGVALAYDRLDERVKIGSFFGETVFRSLGFRLGLGIVSMAVGVFQFLTVAPGDVRVVGDLIPAITGIVAGGMLVLQYYQEKTTLESRFLETMDRLLLRNASNIGVLAILIGVLHFFFHRVLFL